MTSPTPDPLEQLFQEARRADSTLGGRLKFVADWLRIHEPHYTSVVDEFVERLELVRAGSNAPLVGETMPDFFLPDHDGHLVSLSSLLEEAPVVLAFHRGHWCTYCRLNMAGLAQIEDRAKPTQIVAISSEIQQHTRVLRDEAKASFPFLTDLDSGFALSLNLAIWVDEKMAAILAGAGLEIPGYQGGEAWILPVPAVFVVGQDGIIAARHVDPDYRRRMELDDLLHAIDLVRVERSRPVGRTDEIEQRRRLA